MCIRLSLCVCLVLSIVLRVYTSVSLCCLVLSIVLRVYTSVSLCCLVQEREFAVQQANSYEAELNRVLEKQKANMKALEVRFMDAKQDLQRSA